METTLLRTADGQIRKPKTRIVGSGRLDKILEFLYNGGMETSPLDYEDKNMEAKYRKAMLGAARNILDNLSREDRLSLFLEYVKDDKKIPVLKSLGYKVEDCE